ncbi:uncharacterized protein PAC_01194 [Phialocephala subalpina]|uniref:Heterokaryon incompatibility domain-containing protein n=1 Tax=Phialocephala subalpina TaxID=576137 RepID=A0A1L7WF09_9HELO|nr:uncharacterized protein PAC_01194 [Phialocephala subalpina]
MTGSLPWSEPQLLCSSASERQFNIRYDTKDGPIAVITSQSYNAMEYMPLDTDRNEIRLLKLLPGDGDVYCNLEHASLINPPEFCALSYCWGDLNITATITINDVAVQITANLESALRRLRAKELGCLWVDSICINQMDKVEKNQQLIWMGSIYRRAKEVHAWTGEAGDDFNRAFCTSVTDPGHLGKESDTSLVQFLDRPYWKRVWIVQELAFARTTIVHCGEKHTDWKSLTLRVSEIQSHHLGFHPSVRSIENLVRFQLDAEEVKPLPFIEALYRTHSALSTDPRDKVFALLGLSYDANLYVPIPNYKQSLRDLCIGITLSATTTTSKLDTVGLLCLGTKQDNTFGLPTWAINWFALDDDKTRALEYICQAPRTIAPFRLQKMKVEFLPRRPQYHAVGTTKGSISMINDVLRVRAMLFDKIDGICPTPEEFQNNITIPIQQQSKHSNNAYTSLCTCYGGMWLHVVSALTRYFTSMETGYSYEEAKITAVLARWYTYIDLLSRGKASRQLLTKHDEEEKSVSRVLGSHKQDDRIVSWLLGSRSFRVSDSTLLDLATEYSTLHPDDPDIRPGTFDPSVAAFRLRQSTFEEHSSAYELSSGFAERTLAPVLDDNMRFMTTKRGCVGWAHINGKKDDFIGIMAGCSVPAILRAREGGGFYIVGDAYVDGVMNGELVKMQDNAWQELEIH